MHRTGGFGNILKLTILGESNIYFLKYPFIATDEGIVTPWVLWNKDKYKVKRFRVTNVYFKYVYESLLEITQYFSKSEISPLGIVAALDKPKRLQVCIFEVGMMSLLRLAEVYEKKFGKLLNWKT